MRGRRSAWTAGVATSTARSGPVTSGPTTARPVQVRRHGTRLGREQDAGGEVPPALVGPEVRVGTTAGDVGQVADGAAGDAHGQHRLRDDGHGALQAAERPKQDERLGGAALDATPRSGPRTRAGRVGDGERPAVQGRAAIGGRRERLTRRRQAHGAGDDPVVRVAERDRHGPTTAALDEVGRAVERVDVPAAAPRDLLLRVRPAAPAARSAGPGSSVAPGLVAPGLVAPGEGLLADDDVAGIGAEDVRADQGLGLAVGGGDDVAAPLVLRGDARAEVPQEQLAGLGHGRDRDRELRGMRRGNGGHGTGGHDPGRRRGRRAGGVRRRPPGGPRRARRGSRRPSRSRSARGSRRCPPRRR